MMTRQEYRSIVDSNDMIKITYETKYSKGEIHVKRLYYLKVMKKFTKTLKDAVITSMEEYKSVQEKTRDFLRYYGILRH